MPNDDRSEMEAARLAGLQKRHEQRLESATYTAAEVKVLTEAALRLGRKEAGEEIALALEEFAANDIRGRADMSIDRAASIAREIGSRPSPDATSGRTDPEEPTSLQTIADPGAIERCPVRGWGTVGSQCVRPARHDGKHEWEEPA